MELQPIQSREELIMVAARLRATARKRAAILSPTERALYAAADKICEALREDEWVETDRSISETNQDEIADDLLYHQRRLRGVLEEMQNGVSADILHDDEMIGAVDDLLSDLSTLTDREAEKAREEAEEDGRAVSEQQQEQADTRWHRRRVA